MHAENNFETDPTTGRRTIFQRLHELGQWLFTPPVEAPSREDWYAGLCVDPQSFSDQLIKLQISLRGANDSARAYRPFESGVKARRG